jgi:hypothetical protein
MDAWATLLRVRRRAEARAACIIMVDDIFIYSGVIKMDEEKSARTQQRKNADVSTGMGDSLSSELLSVASPDDPMMM